LGGGGEGTEGDESIVADDGRKLPLVVACGIVRETEKQFENDVYIYICSKGKKTEFYNSYRMHSQGPRSRSFCFCFERTGFRAALKTHLTMSSSPLPCARLTTSDTAAQPGSATRRAVTSW
jgi:hypothetical protein